MRLIYFISIFMCCLSCAETTERLQPIEQELIESVYASVTIQPDNIYEVYAIVSGILDANLVEEGDFVIKDQSLIQIINNTPKLNALNSKLSLELAEQNFNGSAAILNSIKSEIDDASISD